MASLDMVLDRVRVILVGLKTYDEPLELGLRKRHGGHVAISEAERHDLYNGLSAVIGPERAATLMSAIPLYDLDEVATKGDLRVSSADLRAEIAELRAEVIAEIAAFRRTMTNWMITLLIAIIAAMASVNFIS